VVSSLMEEAIASSQLEGAVTTTKAAKWLLREKRMPRSKDEEMVVNNYLTMQRIQELRETPLSVDMILELHKLAVNGTLRDPAFEGRFREDDDIVVADPLEPDKIYHRPPSHDKVPGYMAALCGFINSDDGGFQHPLVKAIILHFMIGYAHPFVDGNGRLARALMYWYALKSNYWLFRYMAISKAIKETKGEYGRAYLHSETDDNDITYFINYNLSAMEGALENTRRYLADKQSEQKAAEEMAKAHPALNFRQAEILRDMIRHEGEMASIAEIASKFGVVHQTARTDLQSLHDLGLVKKVMVGKAWRFYYEKGERALEREAQGAGSGGGDDA